MRVTCSCVATYGDRHEGDAIESTIAAWTESGARVIDVQGVAHGHATEVYCVGDDASIERGALASAAIAAKAIDVTVRPIAEHVIGATHRLVLTPLSDATAAECVELSGRIARQAALELGVPVYLFGRAATRPSRVDLAAVASGGYLAVQQAIGTESSHAPDFGPSKLGSAGAMAIGVQDPVLTLILRLGDAGPQAAESIAAALDGRSGGLSYARAEPAGMEAGATAAVYVTLQDAGRTTPLYRVMELARAEARRVGSVITGASVHGLVSIAVLHEAAAAYLNIDAPRDAQLLELAVAQTPPASDETASGVRGYLDMLASEEPSPGGGGAAALVGAMASALAAMIAGVTASVSKDEADEATLQRMRRSADELGQALLALVDDDVRAHAALQAAYELPRATADDVDRRRNAVQAALRDATDVPISVAAHCVDVLRLARDCAELGNVSVVGDAGIAAHLALGAARSSALHVAINVMGLRDLDEGDQLRRASQQRLAESEAMATEVARLVDGRIKA